MTRYKCKHRRIAAALCLMLAASQMALAQAPGQHEFLLFPTINGFDTLDESDESVRKSSLDAGISGLYSYSGDHFRFLGEYLLSTRESELERLKAGWTLTDNATLWIGRFHAPSRFWMHEFHHGQYMQTSITRPSLEEWEDESGSTPSHVAGLQFEYEQILEDESSIEYAFTVGFAPTFNGSELVPFDILDPESGHGASINARIGIRPKFFDAMSYGFIASWNEIDVELPGGVEATDPYHIDQLTVGGFADWRWQDLRLITSAVYFVNKLYSLDGIDDDDFVLTYVQPEYELRENLTVFGRADIGFGEDHSPYLGMLPAFIAHRNMLGIRWEFARFQALTMEVAETAAQGPTGDHRNFKEIRLQWSAVIQ